MLKNYLTISMRNLLGSKGHTLINLLGLAIGMACHALKSTKTKTAMPQPKALLFSPLISVGDL
tara:strand:+ start:187 stop:375 length:189 start_codon:yes stop_codon:yes gene_type:complete